VTAGRALLAATVLAACGRSGGNHVVVLDSLDAVTVVTTVDLDTRGMHDQTTRLLEARVWPLLAWPAQ
jgi:hypothetical protein